MKLGSYMFSNIAVLDFESQLFCIVIVSILLYKQRSSTNQAEVQFVFSHVLISQIVFFAVGILRIIVTENTFFNTWEMVYLANAAYFIAFNATTYECFRYIVIYEGVPLLQSRKNRFLAQIPLIFNALMILLTPITRLYYVIDGNADFAMMPLWYLNPAISVFYPIAGIFANYLYRRSQDRGELRRYRLLIAFPLLIICSTLLQLLDWAIPFLPDGIVLADLIVYISYTDSLISKDPLTGINNRSELTRYLTGRIRQNNLQAELYYFIMDIDKFKHINDTYGHGEGDHALVLLANALKRVSSSRETRCFISRYGGDEFVVIAELPSVHEARTLAAHIREAVAEEAKHAGVPYDLLVSVGFACFRKGTNTDTASGLMAAADEMLYIEKKRNAPDAAGC